jgi:DNA replication protein DnaC
MLNTPTEQKLQSMRLGVMADTWLGQNRETEASELSFDERFGLIVDAEHLYRENRKLTRLLHDAKLRIQGANLEDIRASAASGLSSEVLSQMRSERWITEHLNVLLSGSTGVGKTHLACALGQFAWPQRVPHCLSPTAQIARGAHRCPSGWELREAARTPRKSTSADH